MKSQSLKGATPIAEDASCHVHLVLRNMEFQEIPRTELYSRGAF